MKRVFISLAVFLLAVLGILLVGSLSEGSLTKGIFAGALGIAIGAVGMDPLTFTERFTFGVPLLTGGITFVAVMIGMFAVANSALINMMILMLT